MAPRSSVENDPEVRVAIDRALRDGHTLDQIVAAIRALGSEVSRSAVGRYASQYRRLAERERDIQAVARSYAADFGGDENPTGKLLIHLVTSIATRTALASDDDEIAPKDLGYIAKAVKDIIGAAKVDADRDAHIRREERARAAADAAKAARKAGASEGTIAAIAEALGIAA